MDSDMSDDASFAAPLSRSMSGASLSRHSSAASLASARSGSYSVVKLSVGGARFQTTLATLQRFPGTFLEVMFNGTWRLELDDKGYHFIDRDGTHFRHILNFLREPAHFECELTPCELRELRRECKYYGLDDLMFPPPESPVVFSFKATLFKSGAGDTFVAAQEKRECVEVDARAAKKMGHSTSLPRERLHPSRRLRETIARPKTIEWKRHVEALARYVKPRSPSSSGPRTGAGTSAASARPRPAPRSTASSAATGSTRPCATASAAGRSASSTRWRRRRSRSTPGATGCVDSKSSTRRQCART